MAIAAIIVSNADRILIIRFMFILYYPLFYIFSFHSHKHILVTAGNHLLRLGVVVVGVVDVNGVLVLETETDFHTRLATNVPLAQYVRRFAPLAISPTQPLYLLVSNLSPVRV